MTHIPHAGDPERPRKARFRPALGMLVGIAALAPVSGTLAADAADYPSRPVRVVVGFPAGSGTDMLARFIGDGAAFLLYVLAAIWLGFAAPGLRRHALQWRGWTLRGARIAPSADLAQLEALQ